MTVFYTKFKSPICEIILAGNEDGLSNLHLQTEDGKREFSIEEAWVRNDVVFCRSDCANHGLFNW